MPGERSAQGVGCRGGRGGVPGEWSAQVLERPRSGVSERLIARGVEVECLKEVPGRGGADPADALQPQSAHAHGVVQLGPFA